MKTTSYICFLLAVGLMFCSCSKDDDDSNTPDTGATFFMWDIDGTTFDAASTSTYDGSVIYISAQDRVDDQITLEIRSKTNSTGVKILNKNDGDADDDQLMVMKFLSMNYYTTVDHFIELNITSIDEGGKTISGTFSGEVVNRTNANDVLQIENGSFKTRYF